MGLLRRLRVPIGWTEVARRTGSEVLKDNVLGLAAELAYYFFLALFPALLFLVALASFFPIHQLTDQIVATFAGFAPGDVFALILHHLQPISNNTHAVRLTLTFLR